jgi:hypothetical protein
VASSRLKPRTSLGVLLFIGSLMDARGYSCREGPVSRKSLVLSSTGNCPMRWVPQALHWERGRPARISRREIEESVNWQAICSHSALIAGGTPAVPVKSLKVKRGHKLPKTPLLDTARDAQ